MQLDLAHNGLTSLTPETAQLSNLTTLNLSSNKFTSLPLETLQLRNLTKLYLSDNDFSQEENQKIKNLLPNCSVKFLWGG